MRGLASVKVLDIKELNDRHSFYRVWGPGSFRGIQYLA